MQRTQLSNRSKSSSQTLLDRPFITVEKSFEISFDYTPMELRQSLGQQVKSNDASMIQPVSSPGTTYRVETSIVRPSTAQNISDKTFDMDDPVCPSPIVRSSQDKIDLHEALRSQLPPLRQSRRWAKTYLSDNEQARPNTGVRTSAATRQTRPSTATRRPQHTGVPTDTAYISDNESEHFGLCRPAHVPGWHVFKNRRLIRRLPTSVKTLKTPTTDSPKRVKSIKSIRTHSQADSRRVVMPNAVQGKKTNQDDSTKFAIVTPKRWRRRRAYENSPQSSISAFSEALIRKAADCAGSPVSSLHDYEKVKRFSQECVDMLSGLDFGDEWRVSIVGPALSIEPRPSVETLSVPSKDSRSRGGRVPSNSTWSSAANTREDALQRFQRALKANVEGCNAIINHTGFSPSPQPVNVPSIDTLRSTASGLSNDTSSAFYNSVLGGHPPLSNKSSQSSFGRQIYKTIPGNLKNARSIDTLTQIEAQVEDTPAPSIHQLERKGSTFTLTSSPKRQRPAGEPPVRPLPNLPKDDASDAQSTLHRKPSFASSHKSRVVRGTLGSADLFKMSSVQTMIHIPSMPAERPEFPLTDSERSVSRATSAPRQGRSKESIDNSETCDSATDIFGSDLNVKHTAVNVCHNAPSIKQRHIGASSKFPDDTSGVTDATTEMIYSVTVETGSESRLTKSSSLVNTTQVQHAPNQHPGTRLITSKTLPVLTSQGNFAHSLHIPFTDNRLKAVHHRANSPDLVRTSSKASSSVCKKPQVKSRKLKTAASSPNLQQYATHLAKPKQSLARSQIMVVVDTNPHTASFCASTLSPRPSSNWAEMETPQQPVATQTEHDRSPSVDLENLAELIDIVKPPPSVQKRRSFGGLRSQSSGRSLAQEAAKHAAGKTLASVGDARLGSHAASHHKYDSSDSELEESPLLKRDQTLTSHASRATSRTSLRRTHTRKDSPLTTVLKEEVRKADLELENLKRYEQRIEYLQLHLEQTLRVWGRMSQSGKQQYLSSTFGALDRKSSVRSKATSSVYSKRSSVQKLDEAVSRSLKEALDFSRGMPMEFRPTSGTSSATRTSTDTDTDWSVDATNGQPGKRASGGSLTDPQDYDPSPGSRHLTASTTQHDSTCKRTKSDSLGLNLDDFRARLQASRPPLIPARRCKLRTPSREALSTTTSSPSSREKDKLRIMVAPWEEHEPKMTRRFASSSSRTTPNPSSDHIDRLNLDQETLRTDQMDAMLAL